MGLEAIQGLADVVRHSRVQNGRFFGYVLGSGDPVAAATDLLCSVLNQNVTAWWALGNLGRDVGLGSTTPR
jgi:aromatic-L-amino-acid/L-tryptophan decarboxylase